MKIKNKIQEMISAGRTDYAIKELSRLVKNKDSYLYDQILLLSGRWETIEKDNLMGIINHSDYLRERAKITYAILNLLNDVEKYEEFTNDNSTNKKNNIFLKGNNNIVIQGVKNSSILDDDKLVKTLPKTRILFLASNPTDTAKLQLAEEYRRVAERLQESGQSNKFEFYQKWAVTVDELQDSILTIKPHIIHFSGHGKKKNLELQELAKSLNIQIDDGSGLIFKDRNGKSKVVKTRALSNMFELFESDKEFEINTVILNACYSENQAKAISQYVPFVIGMSNKIGDKAALEFSTGFYRGLANGKNIEFCYKLGRNKIDLEDLEGENTVKLFKLN